MKIFFLAGLKYDLRKSVLLPMWYCKCCILSSTSQKPTFKLQVETCKSYGACMCLFSKPLRLDVSYTLKLACGKVFWIFLISSLLSKTTCSVICFCTAVMLQFQVDSTSLGTLPSPDIYLDHMSEMIKRFLGTWMLRLHSFLGWSAESSIFIQQRYFLKTMQKV